MPWCLIVGGIALFGVLTQLRIVRLAEADMIADATGVPTAAALTADAEPRWKRNVRAAYVVVFISVWLGILYSFYALDRLAAAASPLIRRTRKPSPSITIITSSISTRPKARCSTSGPARHRRG